MAYTILIIGFIILIVICRKITNKLLKARKPKDDFQPKHIENTEEYIPKSIMNAVFECSKCGASVPFSVDKSTVTMFCPFCGSSLDDAHKIMERAIQSKNQEHDYAIRIKELEAKEREQSIELKRIKKQRAESRNDVIISIVVFGVIILGLCCIFGPILWASGAFR